MAQFYSLFSSSQGNAHFVGTAEGGLLIDVGVFSDKLRRALMSREIPLSAVQGIFITHTHTDHVKGLKVFLKHTTAKVWGTAETLRILQQKNMLSAERIGGTITEGAMVQIAGYEVTAFFTPHDADGSCGYRIQTPDGRICGICTDLGYMPQTVMDALQGCDLVLLESNYDQQMLLNGSYPMPLKRRISGNFGHLSNDDCAEAAVRLVQNGTKRLILGHLSQENNRPALVYQTVTKKMTMMGFERHQDYLLLVTEPNGYEGVILF